MKIRNSSRQNAEKSGPEVENKGAKEYIIDNFLQRHQNQNTGENKKRLTAD
ncbi:MAG: hypothetical protein SPK75_00990 [Victivallales bacterium]|nr:hypothetical protein [Victivallales bacterium]